MPFGPKNGPAAFARLVYTTVKSKLSNVPMCLFFDDFLIGSKTWQEHLGHVEGVLKRLREQGITIESSKAKMGMPEVNCLGFIVGEGGLRSDPEKVRAVRKFPRPKTKKQIKAYLGLMNFYGTFAERLQVVLRPLNRALSGDAGEAYAKSQENAAVVWTPEMDEAFEKSKQLFSDEIELALPNLDEPLNVTTDASENGIGEVLSQKQAD